VDSRFFMKLGGLSDGGANRAMMRNLRIRSHQGPVWARSGHSAVLCRRSWNRHLGRLGICSNPALKGWSTMGRRDATEGRE
jgi:hypothetical protein